jgi:hypothetical protein
MLLILEVELFRQQDLEVEQLQVQFFWQEIILGLLLVVERFYKLFLLKEMELKQGQQQLHTLIHHLQLILPLQLLQVQFYV